MFQFSKCTQINPQHTVPTLKDGDFYVNESRAAAIYLVEKYSNDKLLYPNDIKIRTVINQRLFFDIGTFYKSCIGDIVVRTTLQGRIIYFIEGRYLSRHN